VIVPESTFPLLNLKSIASMAEVVFPYPAIKQSVIDGSSKASLILAVKCFTKVVLLGS